MVVLRLAALVVGAWIVLIVLRAELRTFVVPRGEQVLSSRLVFLLLRPVYERSAARKSDPERGHAIMSRHAPTALLGVAATWAVMIIIGFALMDWSSGGITFGDAVRLSGSSFTTVGFIGPRSDGATALAVLEAFIGLGLVALLIAYLPTIYANFSRREAEVVKLETRAGSPPSPVVFLTRLHAIGWTDRLADTWAGWEQWFAELEESHTSQPSLALFRSQHPTISWVTAAGTVLDAASLSLAAIDLPPEPQASITIRAGFLSLRAIAEFFGAPIDHDPSPDDPISIPRAEFDAVLDELAAAGVPLKADRDQAWRDYAGWRVNYDIALLALCALLQPAPALWSSDRVNPFRRISIRHPRRWAVRRADGTLGPSTGTQDRR